MRRPRLMNREFVSEYHARQSKSSSDDSSGHLRNSSLPKLQSPAVDATLVEDQVEVPTRSSSKAPSTHRANTSDNTGSSSMSTGLAPETPSHPPRTGTHPRPKWGRHVSEGLFLDRYQSGRTVLPSLAWPKVEARISVSPTIISPLRPPVRPVHTGQATSSHSTVKVEASFTKPMVTQNEAHGQVVHKTANEDVCCKKQLVPSLLRPLSRLRWAGGRHGGPAFFTHKMASRPFPHHHRSGWRKNNTAGGLARVSSLLADVLTSKTARRSRSGRSLSTEVSKPKRTGTQFAGDKQDHMPLESVQSMEMVSRRDSDGSSLAMFRMGSPPPNTPEEQATYRVRRSASRETEEFLKIDISIRGGTSYLPSEARRIHTPPPLKEGLDGKKRGFFFNYHIDTTELDLSRDESDVKRSFRLLKEDAKSIKQPGAIPSTPEFGLTRSNTSQQRHRKKKVDWYSIQLAELDLSYEEDYDSMGFGQRWRDHGPFSRASTFSTQQPSHHTAEGQFDYSIPEHLPSSPLCPRNPKYWRVVRDGTDHFRGCWMHGIDKMS